MTTPPSGNNQQGQSAEEARSEGLLPASDKDAADGRYDVAEEVNLDQQSDSARKVGQAAPEAVDAMNKATQDKPGEPLAPAVERAIPKSQ